MLLVPYGDWSEWVREGRARPYATWSLIALNVAIALMVRGGDLLFAADHFGFVPQNPSFVALFTCMFLHAGPLHLIGNMLFLWIAGPPVEQKLSVPGFLALYVSTGLASTVAHSLADPASELPLIGASGAISGVMGAYAILCTYRRVKFFYWVWLKPGTFELSAGWAVGFWFAEQLWSLFSSRLSQGDGGIAFVAHIGGAIVGALASVAMIRLGRADRDVAPTVLEATALAARLEELSEVGSGVPLNVDASRTGRERERRARASRRDAQLAEVLSRLRGAALNQHERYDIFLPDRNSLRDRCAQAVAKHTTRHATDVKRQLNKGTGFLGLDLAPRETAAVIEELNGIGVRAVALRLELVPETPTIVHLVRATADGIRGSAGRTAEQLAIRWSQIESADASLSGTRPQVDIIAVGRRFRLHSEVAGQASVVARAILNNTPSLLGLGRGLEQLAEGSSPEERGATEYTRALGSLSALARLERSAGDDAAYPTDGHLTDDPLKCVRGR